MSIAFFDFDGTLIRHEAGVICAIPSIRQGLIGPRIGARLIATYLLSKVRLRTRTDAMRVGFLCYAGRTLAELEVIMQGLYDDHVRAHLSGPMQARIDQHRREGDHLVILTASATFVAEPIGRDLGIGEVIGTRVRFVEDRCTGLVEGEILDGAAKLSAAQACADRLGVELGRCTFYSDHIADLPLLEAVGTPVAVGPHRPLERIARARGWSIVDHGAKLSP